MMTPKQAERAARELLGWKPKGTHTDPDGLTYQTQRQEGWQFDHRFTHPLLIALMERGWRFYPPSPDGWGYAPSEYSPPLFADTLDEAIDAAAIIEMEEA